MGLQQVNANPNDKLNGPRALSALHRVKHYAKKPHGGTTSSKKCGKFKLSNSGIFEYQT
jgi:hypothetical protein